MVPHLRGCSERIWTWGKKEVTKIKDERWKKGKYGTQEGRSNFQDAEGRVRHGCNQRNQEKERKGL
jgi:hypothetical protein